MVLSLSLPEVAFEFLRCLVSQKMSFLKTQCFDRHNVVLNCLFLNIIVVFSEMNRLLARSDPLETIIVHRYDLKVLRKRSLCL